MHMQCLNPMQHANFPGDTVGSVAWGVDMLLDGLRLEHASLSPVGPTDERCGVALSPRGHCYLQKLPKYKLLGVARSRGPGPGTREPVLLALAGCPPRKGFEGST